MPRISAEQLYDNSSVIEQINRIDRNSGAVKAEADAAKASAEAAQEDAAKVNGFDARIKVTFKAAAMEQTADSVTLVLTTDDNREVRVALAPVSVSGSGMVTAAQFAGLQSDIDGKAENDAVVHKTGAEAITGTKTFECDGPEVNSIDLKRTNLSVKDPDKFYGGNTFTFSGNDGMIAKITSTVKTDEAVLVVTSRTTKADDTHTDAVMRLVAAPNGKSRLEVPAPEANSNSSCAATTKWVRDLLAASGVNVNMSRMVTSYSQAQPVLERPSDVSVGPVEAEDPKQVRIAELEAELNELRG